MGVAASGKLAAAVSTAGGLGLVGIGYGGSEWIKEQSDAAANVRVGFGFITWRLAEQPDLLELALDRQPTAICLSFGDPRPFAEQILAAGVRRVYTKDKGRWYSAQRLKDWETFGTMRADQKIPISLMGICLLYRRDPPLTLPRQTLAAQTYVIVILLRQHSQ